MSKLEFCVNDTLVIENKFFSDATADELRVLLSLRELGGAADADEVCRICSISVPRLKAALSFWETAGVISPLKIMAEGEFGNRVITEFEENPLSDELDDMTGAELAEEIRDEGLRVLFEEISGLMGKPELSYMEMNRIAAMISQYKINDEYIALIAAHLAEKNMLSIHRLTLKVRELIKRDICTPDELGAYISDEEEQKSSKYSEYRRALGIYNRTLSESEVALLDKWTDTYFFGVEIVKKAYDYAVMSTGSRSFSYMDALLSDWNSVGCKTVAECEKRHESERARLMSERAEAKSEVDRIRRESKKQTPRFGDFDPEEVMKRALERTYADESSDKSGG